MRHDARRRGSAGALRPGDASRSRCRCGTCQRQLASFEQQAAREGEVGGGGDLDVARVARHRAAQCSRPARRAQPRRSPSAPCAPSSRTRARTSRRNPCGVCARKIVSRGSVRFTAGTGLGCTAGIGSPNSVPTHDVSVMSASFTVSPRRQRRNRRAGFGGGLDHALDVSRDRRTAAPRRESGRPRRRRTRRRTALATESCRRGPPSTTRTRRRAEQIRRQAGQRTRRAARRSTSRIAGRGQQRRRRCARAATARPARETAWAPPCQGACLGRRPPRWPPHASQR